MQYIGASLRKYKDIIWVIALILAADQATKLAAMYYLQPVGSVSLIGDFFRLTYVENPGMAFGIELDNKVLFHTLSIFAVLIIFYYLFRLRQHPLLRLSFAVILGGAIGNLIDRFWRGSVVDFLDVDFMDIQISGGQFFFWEYPAYLMTRWPVFNIADIAITIGMLLILIITIFDLSSQPILENAAGEEIQIND